MCAGAVIHSLFKVLPFPSPGIFSGLVKMRFMNYVLQLALIAQVNAKKPGGRHNDSRPDFHFPRLRAAPGKTLETHASSTSHLPKPTTTTTIPDGEDCDESNFEPETTKPRTTTSSATTPSTTTKPSTTSRYAFHPVCYHSANYETFTAEHGWCVCDGGITHSAPPDAQCPQSTVPAHWIPPKSSSTITAAPTTSLKPGDTVDYSYTFQDYAAGGARVLCQTSSVFRIGDSKLSATSCVGSRSTLSPGVSHTIVVSATDAHPISVGNWAEEVSQPSPIAPEVLSSESSVLSSSLYNAFSKACIDTTTTRVMTQKTTVWGDNLHSMTTVMATPTYTACGSTGLFDVVSVGYLEADKQLTGTIQVSVLDSYFHNSSIHNLMHVTAKIYAASAILAKNIKFKKYQVRGAQTGFTHDEELAQHLVPQFASTSFYASYWLDMQQHFATQLHFKIDQREKVGCEIMSKMMDELISTSFMIIPGAGPLVRAGTKAAGGAIGKGIEKACVGSAST